VKQATATRIAEITAETKKPRSDHEDADDRRDHADHRDDQGEDQPVVAERGLAKDERRDQHDRVRLEQVGRHTGTVTDVVTDVVGDGRGVPGVVLRDALLNLADQVRADVRGLGVDAAADTHEHREQRRAEAETLKDVRGIPLVDEHDDGRAEQAKPHREHPRHATGAEGDPHGVPLAPLAGRRRYPDVAAHAQRHAGKAGRPGEDRADEEEETASPADAITVGGQHEQDPEDNENEDA
jgi:hypothetical protein